MSRPPGLGPAVVMTALERLRAGGRVLPGEFRPGASAPSVCDAEVLRLIRRRSLRVASGGRAGSRRGAGPVCRPGKASARNGLRGADGLLRAVEQLAGVLLPASSLESFVLPSRVEGYSPALLDELTLAGEVLWAGAGALAGNDGWIALAPRTCAAAAAETVPPPDGEVYGALLAALDGDQAMFFRPADRPGRRRRGNRSRPGDVGSGLDRGLTNDRPIAPGGPRSAGERTAPRRRPPYGPRD